MKIVLAILGGLLALVLLVAGVILGVKHLAPEVPASSTPAASAAGPELDVYKPVADYAEMLDALDYAKTRNQDTVGWLKIPGTDINNCVVQSFDNTYYLRRDEQKQYANEGCYYMDYECSVGAREDLSPNTIIYGHSWDDDPDGAKFGQLFRFVDTEFAAENPCFEFSTSQIATLLFSSFILVSILVFVFIYTLYSIISQQKLTTMKNDFINHVTHEIKTPISTISLICESFNDSDMHYDKQSTLDAIKIIQHESDRLSSLSRQIIELSKLENGDYFLNKTNFDLHQAIDDAINNTGFQVMHKKGKIYLNLSAQNSWIFGDKTHITHIISNIIDNANKYNSEKPSIHISSQNVKNGIQIDIQDNGIGINKQHLKKIFNKLYRIPTGNTHDIKGFGLGLSYVKSIVLQHQGKVWVESEPKKGSTFHLFFPQNL